MAPDLSNVNLERRRYCIRAVHMECNAAASDAGKQSGSRTKTPGIPTSTRMQRNLAEKERRDKLNGFISELATLVPMVSNASKPLDKVSILRLAAAEMRLHFSCLNPKKYKNKPLTLPPSIISSLDLIEKTIGGFILVTTLSGVIVFCSRSIEDYLGYQNIDVMGNKVVKYIYEDDIKYFEAKVGSVVNSLKKSSKKKSRVIKAHMLQKPLPRSNECSRPRNMIFKISVHQNDITEMNSNGMNEQSSSTLKKTRPPKDFGYSAVVLMFIEPVRLEPEIDITYIDSNQDVYFTRHGLQGEIIYADQRISSITGYMPHDVQGTSAYQYICSSDVPIALFAQKAMFTSNDGKGVIVYRLRIRDMRFIYLQSSGQIAYKESSSEISHFVCFNRLLSEEEGSQELKKFQQRYAPQIMAAKMLKVKQGNAGGPDAGGTDFVLEQAFAFIKSSGMADTSPVSQKSPFQYSKDPVDSVLSSSSQKPSSDGFVSPSSNSSVGSSSVHSSEGHSIISPLYNGRSSSVGSDFNGYISEQVENPNQKTARSDCTTIATNPYCTVNNCGNESDFSPGSQGSCASGNNYDRMMETGKLHHSEIVHTNGLVQQTGSSINSKLQNEVMHSVNAYSNPNSITDNNSSGGTLSDHTLDSSFNNTVLQKNASFTLSTVPSNSYAIQSNGIMPGVNEEHIGYIRYSDRTSNIQPENVNGHLSVQSNPQLPLSHSAALHALHDQQQDFNGQCIPQSRLSHFNDVSSFLRMSQASPVSCLSKNSLPAVSDLNDALGCNSGSLYRESSSFSNSYLTNSISSYSNGANESVVYNDLNIIGTKSLNVNPCETNGFHVPTSSGDVLGSFPSVATYDPMDTSVETTVINQTSEKNLERQIDMSEISFTATASLKPPMTFCHNGSSDDFSSEPLDWADVEVHPDLPEGVDLAMNKELYRELDLFFLNFPESENMRDASVLELRNASSSSYSQNSSMSSSNAKTNYHQ